MTTAHIYDEMTWAEVGSAVDYIYRFELTERHYKGKKKLDDWLYVGRDNLPDDLRRVVKDLRKG